MDNYNNSSLKRVQSEGKLLFVLDNNNNNQIINKLKNNQNSIKNNQKDLEQIKINQKWPTPPAMGVSGRKLDSREYGRLVRMKKASRSQPQLSELFDNGGDSNPERWRNNTNINRTLSTREELGRNKSHQKTKKAPPPPIIPLHQPSLRPTIHPHSPPFNNDNDKNEKESDIYAIVNVKGSKAQHNRQQIVIDPIYRQGTVYREPSTKSPQMLIENHNHQVKQYNHQNYNQNHKITSPQSRRNNNNGRNVFKSMPASNYADELLPQVAKHEQFLEEEFQLVIQGHQTAQKLVQWYNGRIESLDKRRRMLERGIVALDSAVHEQKLNFYRAKIAEINRRIKTFLISSDRNAFPGSQLNSLSSPSSTSPIIPEQYHQSIHQQTIRNQVHPPPFLHPISNNHPETTGSTGSNDASSASSSGSLPFEYCMSTASEADFLRAQNQKLLGDVRNLTSEIECLRREHQKQNFSKRLDNAYRNYGGYLSGDSENNSSNHGIRDFTSCRAFPNVLRNYYDDNFQMQKRTPRDTLL